MNTIVEILRALTPMFLWMIGFFVVFGVLGRLMPCNPRQPRSFRTYVTNAAYFFFMPVLSSVVRTWYIGVGVFIVYHGLTQESIENYIVHGFGPLGALPIWAQAAIIFIVSDIILYWTHRGFHTKNFWPFHAIHHSSKHVDWHSTYRFHPINTWLTFTLVDSIMLFVGFSLEAVTLMNVFNMLYSAMVHANLNWTFGPFKYCFSSPVFHRWHHTAQAEGMDKNFAPTFPLLDIVFGTFYMPEGRVPEHYGVPGANIPESFWGQMVYPFLKQK